MGQLGVSDFHAAFAESNPEWVKGDADAFGFHIDEIQLKSGDIVRPQAAGVTAIVGANNSGKSTILRELVEELQRQPYATGLPRLALDRVTPSIAGEIGDVLAWLNANSALTSQSQSLGFTRAMAGFHTVSSIANQWLQRDKGLGGLASFICFYGNATGRLSIGGSAEMRESVEDPPNHPVHHLQESSALRQRISTLSEDVFNQPLTLDILARTIRLRVGETDAEVPLVDNITAEYRQAMASLRPLDEQGDGMRGFFGQILPVITSTYPLIVLDEPEAFLHPPQAHALGVELGRLAMERGVQILVATHDRSLLTGLLDSKVAVSVVRVSRGSGQSRAFQLDASELTQLWENPVLRYSNVLEGLFHHAVVLAEAEGDCAYLAAALDCRDLPERAFPSGEVLFVPTGGKAAMPRVASALKALDMPVVAAPDLDILASENDISSLFSALGGDWTKSGHALWKRATAAQFAPRDEVKVGQVLDALNATLSDRVDDNYTHEIRKQILAAIRSNDSPWQEVKKHGVGSFTGQALMDLKNLLEVLQSVGIVPVRCGELERLAPDVTARKGAGWLQAALGASAQCNERTQEHVARLLDTASALLEDQVSVDQE